MGNFFRTVYESQGGRTPDTADKNQKTLAYVLDGLTDYDWQNSIVSQLNNVDIQYSQVSILCAFRLFLPENIQLGNLKSYYRYIKKDEELEIDQMLDIDNYETLSADDTRIALCDDIFEYISPIILKYKDRFLDFNAVAFIPLLKERFEFIKEGKYVSVRVYPDPGIDYKTLVKISNYTQLPANSLTQNEKELEYHFFENWVNFLQRNGFTTKEILKMEEKPTDESSVLYKDLTDEGLDFYLYGIAKWRKRFETLKDKEKAITDYTFIEKKLKEFREKQK